MTRTSVQYADENITVYPQPCPLKCRYCVSPDTKVLTKDLRWKRIEDIIVGEELLAFPEHSGGLYDRELEIAKVMWKFEREATIYRIVTDLGEVKATAEHPFLTVHNRWKTTAQLKERQDWGWDLRFLSPPVVSPQFNVDYMLGYVNGLSDGDGTLKLNHKHSKRKTHTSWYRVALIDTEPLMRLRDYLACLTGEHFEVKPFSSNNKKQMWQVSSWNNTVIRKIRKILGNSSLKNLDYKKGYLAGIFDAEGSFQNVIRIANTDEHILSRVEEYARNLDFDCVKEASHQSCSNIRIRGEPIEVIRFFTTVNPTILRKKLNLVGKSHFLSYAKLLRVEKLGKEKVVNLQTTSGTFFANGFASHNCWAGLPIWQSRISRAHPFEEASRLVRSKRKLTVVVSFTSEPYQPRELTEHLTRKTLEILSKSKMNHKVMLLAKSVLAEGDFPFFTLYRDYGLDLWIGSTLTSIVAIEDEPSPCGGNPQRIKMLQTAHNLGLKTWVSGEPWIPNVTYPHQIVEATHDFVDWYVFGSLNYAHQLGYVIPEGYYKRELPLAIETLEKYEKPYLIKKELRRLVEGN